MSTKMADPLLLFDNLSSLVYSKSQNNKLVLNKLLDEVNKIDFSYSNFGDNHERFVLVVNQLCYLIPDTEQFLVKKALILFDTFLTKQKIVVEGKTLSVATTWCLNCLKHSEPSLIVQTLTVLQNLIRGNGIQIEHLSDRIINASLDLMKQWIDEDPPYVYLNALKCIEALAVSKNEALPDELTVKCRKVFLNLLYNEPDLKNPIWQGKCYVSAISGLGNLAENPSDVLLEELPEIIGVVKGYMLHGLPGQDSYKVEKVLPTNISLPEQLKPSQPVKKAKGKYDRKSKKKTLTPLADVHKEDETNSKNSYAGSLENVMFANNLTTSDSDYSDGESGLRGKIRSVQTKIRHCALILLGTLLQKGDSKVLTRYLPTLLPDGSQTPHSRTLITCLLKDSSPKCRSEVLIVLSTILSKFKLFLSLADNLSRSSFTTFSTNIGNSLKELHRTLALALIAENSNTVLTHILKTISDLLRCTPYHKLENGILSKLVTHVKAFLSSKDLNIKISALTVFGCVVSVDPATEESRKIICGNFSDFEESFGGKPWLFELCHEVLMSEGLNTALAIECLQVLGALARNFFHETVLAYPDDIVALLDLGSKPGYTIRLYVAKFNETLVHSLQAKVGCEDESLRAPVALCARLWNTLIPGPITQLLLSESPGLRATGCECIANIGIQTYDKQCSLIFDELPRTNQIVCITHMFGCAKDDSSAVRSAAVRALAVFVLFPSLRQDPLFYLDTVDAFFAASVDEDQAVRAQSAWLFGNLAEAALLNVEEGVEEEVEDAILTRLFDSGLKLALDSFKVRPNAIRGIGSLLKIVTAVYVQKHRDQVGEVVEVVVKNAATGTFMKARWNACYALGNALSNAALCPDVRSRALPVLLDLIHNYKNFKVRISAGHAITALPDRSGYSEYYIPVWSAILSALENTANIADFNEYRHRDQLVDQICSCMCHLVSLIVPTDIVSVHDVLVHFIEPLQGHLQRFKDRVMPEKSSVIMDADARLGELMEDGSLSAEVRNGLSLLCAIFLTDRQF